MKQRKNKKKKQTVFLISGTILLIITLILSGIGLYHDLTWQMKDRQAGKQSGYVLDVLENMLSGTQEQKETGLTDLIDIIDLSKPVEKETKTVKGSLYVTMPTETGLDMIIEGTETSQNLYTLIPEEMPYVEIEGNRYLGTLVIPSLSLQLPIILLEEWEPERMDEAPCTYDGSLNTHDLIVMAHNYAAHFRGILDMHPGEEVILQTVDGMTYIYTVTAVDIMNRKEREKLYEGTWDLTLFTCVPRSYNRCAVRCQLISVN